MNNYVQLNNILDSEVGVMISTICFIALIFAVGFFLGRIMRIKKLEDRWEKEFVKLQKTFNRILEEAGRSREISLRREDNKLEKKII